MIPLSRPLDPSVHDLSYAARQARLDALPPMHYKSTALDFIPTPKEDPPPMRIALTVEADSLVTYAKVAQAIDALDGARVLTAELATTPTPPRRRQVASATSQVGMRRLINAALVDDGEILIEYKGAKDLWPRERRVLPRHWNDAEDMLFAIDLDLNEPRWFKLGNMRKVTAS